MTRRSRSALLAAAAVAACVSGCGPSSATVRWADQICGAYVSFLDLQAEAPAANPNDLTGATKRLSTFFAQAIAAADKGLTELAKAGPAPVANGDAAAAQVKGYLERTRSTFVEIKAKIDALEAGDEAGYRRVVGEANASAAGLAQGEATLDTLEANPEFSAAAAQAANCLRVRAVRASLAPSR